MAVDLRSVVEKEISRLNDAIARKTSILASLREDLERHEAVQRILEEGRARKRARPARKRRK